MSLFFPSIFAISVLLEVILCRLLRPLWLVDGTGPAWLRALAYHGGALALNFEWVLGLGLLTAALVSRPPNRSIHLREKPLPGQVLHLGMAACYLVLTLLLGLAPQILNRLGLSPPRAQVMAHGAAACLGLLLVTASLLLRPSRHRFMGLVLLLIPFLLQFVAYWTFLRRDLADGPPRGVYLIAPQVTLYSGLFWPLCFLWPNILPREGRRTLAITILTFLVSSFLILRFDWHTAAQVFFLTMGLRLPIDLLGQLVFLASVGGVLVSLLGLFSTGDRQAQKQALGLLLIALCGGRIFEQDGPKTVLYLVGLSTVIATIPQAFSTTDKSPAVVS